MGAGSAFVCILQSLSLRPTGPFPLLAGLMPLCPLALPASLSGTVLAAHAAVGNLLKALINPLSPVRFLPPLVSVASSALPRFCSSLRFTAKHLHKRKLIIRMSESCD